MAETHAILGENLRLRGRIRGEGNIEIQGYFEGDLELKGEVLVRSSASIRANLQAARILIGGAVVGDLVATQAITLDATARVVGNVRAPHVVIALGAQFKGEIDMGLEPRVVPQSMASAATTKVSNRSNAVQPASISTTGFSKNESSFGSSWSRSTQENKSKSNVDTQSSARAQSNFFSASNPSHEESSFVAHEPPLPVVPAIKKGTKAATMKKKNA